jgi:hypothetical protein
MAQAASLLEVGRDHEWLGEVENRTHDLLEVYLLLKLSREGRELRRQVNELLLPLRLY